MIGGSEREKKFVALIVQQVREGAKEIFVVTDKLGTPTYNLDFARGLARLIESTHYGNIPPVASSAATSPASRWRGRSSTSLPARTSS